MQAVVFQGEGRWSFEERPAPSIGPADARVKVEGCGICGTDLHILEAPQAHPATPGTVLGHEFVGVVEEVGEAVRNVQPGDRVVVDPNIICRTCAYCQAGLPNMCLDMDSIGIFRDGGFAAMVTAPGTNCIPIAHDVPVAHAALAEPLACVLHGVERAAVKAGETVLIQGAGPIGGLFLQVFKASGARVFLSEISDYRTEQALRAGADGVFNPKEEDVGEAIRRETQGLGADVAVDAVGSLFDQSIELARRGGRIVLFGMNSQAIPSIRQNTITRYDLAVYGAFVAPFTFPWAVRLIASGKLNLDALVTHKLPLAEFGHAVETLHAGQGVKACMLIGANES